MEYLRLIKYFNTNSETTNINLEAANDFIPLIRAPNRRYCPVQFDNYIFLYLIRFRNKSW